MEMSGIAFGTTVPYRSRSPKGARLFIVDRASE